MPNEILLDKHHRTSMEKSLKRKNKKKYELNEKQKCKYVVHEMLNPLSVINNCTELMLHKLNDIGRHDDSGNSSGSDNDNDSSSNSSCGSDNDNNSNNNRLSNGDRKQMIVLLSMIKNQINKCTEVSKSIIEKNNDNTVININNMLIEYINNFKINNPTINISFNSNIHNSYHFRSNSSKAYLKIILDNMINNILKYNDSVCIKVNKLKDNRIEMTIGDNDGNKKKELSNSINKNKKSNFIGLEIIEKFCNILGVQWNLIQDEDNNYIYKLIFGL